MSLPRYPHYKDSGVEWLGKVPGHWEVGSMRWLTRRYSGGTPDKTNLSYWEDGSVPWLNSGAVNDRLITEPSTYITDEAFANSSAKWIPVGALVMALAGQGKTKGMVAQLGIPSTCNQSMAAIIPSPKIASRFLYWWLDSNYQNIRNMAGGDLRDGLNLELLGNIQCPLAPLPEQTQIAAFLDRETAKIDELVAEQRRLMVLLREKRQAVISHAVTRGLNPDAPLKPSGIGWLGDVPEHWISTKLSRLVTKVGDGLHGTPEYVDDSEFRFINGNNLSGGSISFTDSTRCVSEEEFDRHRIQLDQTTLLLSINGTIGNVALYQGESVMLGKSAAYINCGEQLLREFLCWFLQSSEIGLYFDYSVTGTTIFNLSLESIRRMPIAVPTIEEQTEIVLRLTERIGNFDGLLAQAQRAIDLLQERRTALIAAAVTGQIDVRATVAA